MENEQEAEIIDNASQQAKTITLYKTLLKTINAFRNCWCEVKTSQELNELCSYFINEVWKDFLKESEVKDNAVCNRVTR